MTERERVVNWQEDYATEGDDLSSLCERASVLLNTLLHTQAPREVVAWGTMDESGVVVCAAVNGLCAEDDCADFNRTLRPARLVPLYADPPAKAATVRPLCYADEEE